MNLESIVLKPIISEKSLAFSKKGQYTFRVGKNLGKEEVKRAVEKGFNVKVSGISSLKVAGKRKSLRNRKVVKLPDWKKMTVSLSSGKIDLFEKE